ncbi:MAG TPA: glycosyltransferase family 1 protein [Crocinitomicaceae bacterium]|nr:glycosyltransferase family 1 protein [Crocinitomicaceae bacterium]
MRIGINTRFLLSNKMEGFGWFTFEVVKRMVEQHPEHEFVFFFDRPYDEKFIFGKNVKPVVLFPPTRSALLIISWFECALPRAMKREKIDLFFSPDGFLSLRSKVKQIGVIHDLNFYHRPQGLPFRYRLYFNYFFPKFTRKATKILTVSNYSKDDIVQTYNVDPSKITVAWNGVSDIFKPISDEEKQQTKIRYTEGENYFLFVGALHERKNLKTLLKAFQQYKEQGKPEKLLIVGANLFSDKSLNLNAVSKEYQQDIHFTGHLKIEGLARVTASATALVFVSCFEGFGIPLVEAMRCGTPIIAGNLTSLPEVVGDAGILVNPFDATEIAKQMQFVAENKTVQAELSAKGLVRSTVFSWDKTANIVWEVIENELTKLK